MDDGEVASENLLLYDKCEKSPGGWDSLWDAGKSILELCESCYGVLKGGTKSGEKEGLSSLRGNKHGKIEGKGDERGWLHRNRSAHLSGRAAICLAFLLNSISN